MIEYQQGNDAARDGCIGEVKDRGEEHAVLTGVDGHPRRHVPFDEREVEHIDHLAVEELTVAISIGLEVCNLRIRWCVEDESVEEAVDDVARCSCRDERKADDITCWSSVLYLAVDEPSDEDDCHDAEKCEEELAAPEFPSEGHAVVLHEDEAEPAGDFDALPQIHARLDTDLDDLVNDKNGHEKDDGKNMFVSSGHLFNSLRH